MIEQQYADFGSAPRKFHVFASHAFRPLCGSYAHADYLSALDHLQAQLNVTYDGRDHPCFKFTSKVDAPCTRTALLRMLQDADFGLIDISDNNQNVLFEAGFLTGKGVPVQYFKSQRSLDLGFAAPLYVPQQSLCIYESLNGLIGAAFGFIAAAAQKSLPSRVHI